MVATAISQVDESAARDRSASNIPNDAPTNSANAETSWRIMSKPPDYDAKNASHTASRAIECRGELAVYHDLG
jgi:hypothetical protein